MPRVSSITVYPIKSLDGVQLARCAVNSAGALENDRRYCFIRKDGKTLNAKKCPELLTIRVEYDLPAGDAEFYFPKAGKKIRFSLSEQKKEIESAFSDYFGEPLTLQENAVAGFPDDSIASGPTIASFGSIKEIRTWYPKIGRNELRRRFRTNILIDTFTPFWEDRLYGSQGTERPFSIGPVSLYGINPCARCSVPARDSSSGLNDNLFQKIYTENRQKTLPAWASADRFDHFYKFAVNTKIPSSQAAKTISLGDEVVLL